MAEVVNKTNWAKVAIIGIIAIAVVAILYLIFGKKSDTTQKNINPNVNPNTQGNQNQTFVPQETTWYQDVISGLAGLWKGYSSTKQPDNSLPKGWSKDCCGNMFDENLDCVGVCFSCNDQLDC